uniref:AAA+ ATPase domain-containing protein n=3 Tax=Aegilops tauschii subsp. strangulata TaxID=200361 RepID=A0A453A1R9_AEGTS
ASRQERLPPQPPVTPSPSPHTFIQLRRSHPPCPCHLSSYTSARPFDLSAAAVAGVEMSAVSVTIGVMRPLLGKLAELAGGEYNKLKGVKKQASFLEKELSAMNFALEKMELMDELDPVARDWRDHVREMSYDMDNCIDDFVRQFGGGHAKVGFIKKTARRLKMLGERHRISDRMEELKALALEANERRLRYKIDECNPNSSSVTIDPRMSTIYVEEAGLVGIEGPSEELLNLLTDTEEKLKVVSILGFGGLGKTTLAKQVYDEIRGKFECTAFVSVSQRPNMTGLLYRIQLKLGMNRSSRVYEVQDIIEDLRQYLTHKRYLIVVDDLWDQSAWNTISRAFPENANGCRVIVTTRVEGVAYGACYGHPECIYGMKPLGEKDSKKLFLHRVYGCEEDHPSQLEDISTEILKKCGGLPLAIITIASLLASHPEELRDEWKSIRNSLGTQFAANPTLEGMKNILNLSYIHLPLHLRACFLHLGIYPEDREIERDDLVRQWSAEGLVNKLHGQDSEVVAKSYFNDLINRSLIQPGRTEDGELVSCRVHDMMLDLILSKCEEHNFLRVECNSEDIARDHGRKYKVRRISMNFSNDGATDGIISGSNHSSLSQVRSLALFGESKYMPPLLHFKHLRVFFFKSFCDKAIDLTVVSQLFQLRYLKVSFEGNIKLPTKIQGLVHLETLELHCNELETPSDIALSKSWGAKPIDLTAISQLFQLRHLKISFRGFSLERKIELPTQLQGLVHLRTLELDCSGELEIPSDIVHLLRLSHLTVPFGTQLPKGIKNMTSLHTLGRFDLDESSLEDIEGLGELTNLRRLGLSVSFPDHLRTTAWVALAHSIGMLHDLRHLCVSGDSSHTSDLLGSLSEHSPHIKVLELGGLRMPRVPKWICGLQCLCRLELNVDTCTDELHALGELPSLVHLRLHMWSIPKDSTVIFSAGSFPVLELCECKSEYDVTAYLAFGAGAMPKLSWLELQFDKSNWGGSAPVGLEHLLSLNSVFVIIRGPEEAKEEAESAFRNCTQLHPNRPWFHICSIPR